MTQDEPTAEVFLGPTGSETEAFYAFQRTHPGLEKTEYLEWFKKKFHKEIELRRRRSDQPSDLEYMVIKKRSKYRERIGEESAELCKFSEENPQKTYRELADWFQDRFGKEIDITAISRALKRGRDLSDGDTLQTDTTPPPAKRARRSPNSTGSGSADQQGAPTFIIDSGSHDGSSSRQHTPNRTPIHTPKNSYITLPSPEERSRLVPYHSNPPPTLPKLSLAPPQPMPQSHTYPDHRGSDPPPPRLSLSGGQGGIDYGDPRGQVDNRSSPRSQQQLTINHSKDPSVRPSRRKSITQHSMQQQQLSHGPPSVPSTTPLQPRTNYPPVLAAPPVPSLGHSPAPSPYPPLKEIVSNFQSRFNSAVEKQARSLDEIRTCHNEIVAALAETGGHDHRLREEHAATLRDKERLLNEMQRLRAWGEDVKRGNIELQGFERGYHEAKERLARADEYNLYLQNSMVPKLEAKLKEQGSELDNARRLLKQNGLDENGTKIESMVDTREIKGRTELNEWIQSKFAADNKHEAQLKLLVEGLESAGWRDLPGKLQTLKAYLQDMCRKREAQKDEWDRVISQTGDQKGQDTDKAIEGIKNETNEDCIQNEVRPIS